MKATLIILFIWIQTQGFSQRHSYENIVFEGAGIRGLAYAGVIKQLENQGIVSHLKKVGGTSAGAITALMLSLGYNSAEIFDIISKTKFQKFNDGEFIFFGGFSRLNKRYGWYKGNEFSKWLEAIIEDKTGNPDITFEELKPKGFKELYVTATCLNKQKLVIFSAETYPKMKVKDAIRVSMSIPLYFVAVFIDSTGNVYKKPKANQNLDIVIDGGILANFPIFIFDSTYVDSLNIKHRIPNYGTIGIRIDSEEQIQRDATDKALSPVEISKLKDYFSAFYNIVLESLNRNTLINEDWERTISVSSVGIGPKIKRLTTDQKMSLIKSGENNTLEFLKNR